MNAAEVVGKLIEAGMPDETALDAVEGLGLEVVTLDAAMGAQASFTHASERVPSEARRGGSVNDVSK